MSIEIYSDLADLVRSEMLRDGDAPDHQVKDIAEDASGSYSRHGWISNANTIHLMAEAMRIGHELGKRGLPLIMETLEDADDEDHDEDEGEL